MPRAHWFMALFGFGITLALILAPSIFSGNPNFIAPYELGWNFILRYYLLALAFFVIFTAAAAIKMKAVHQGQPGRWFGFSLLSFSVGSMLAAGVFLLFMASALSGINPSF